MATLYKLDDLAAVEQQLTDDERSVRDAARAHAQDRLLPRVTEARSATARPTSRSSRNGVSSACSARPSSSSTAASAQLMSATASSREIERRFRATAR